MKKITLVCAVAAAFALTSCGGGDATTADTTDTLATAVDTTVIGGDTAVTTETVVEDQAGQSATVGQKVDTAIKDVKNAAHDVKEGVKDAAHDVKEAAQKGAKKVDEKAKEIKEDMKKK